MESLRNDMIDPESGPNPAKGGCVAPPPETAPFIETRPPQELAKTNSAALWLESIWLQYAV